MQGPGAVVPLGHVVVACAALFAVGGIGLTRLLLPAGLRRHEALWVLPVGACATGLAMTVLGFLAVPFRVNLGVTLLGGAALAVVALRRRPITRVGVAGGARRVALAGWFAALIVAVALIPLFRAGFATVEGQGQDAHLAVGSAMFLQHGYPTSTHIAGPVDAMPLVWRSKYPIYYALASAATLSGHEVYASISAVAALLLGLAVVGFWLWTREVLRAPPWAALAAVGLIGLDRMVLHTVMHPYFNQTWGFFAMPFAFVLASWALEERTPGGIALLALFLAIIGFAYPLALPIPLIPIAVALWPRRHELRLRARVRAGWKGWRSLVWIVPLGLVLTVPLHGVAEKGLSAWNVLLNPRRNLRAWGGDLFGWFPEQWFFGVEGLWALVVLAPALLWLAWLAIRDKPPALRRGLLALGAFAVVATIYFRIRTTGYYFHFKTLAFIAPIALAVVAAGAARVVRPRPWAGPAVLVVLGLFGISAARQEIGGTFDELPKAVLQLRSIDAALPPGRSVRLDIDPQQQNWVAFWLHGQPLDSIHPLLGTSYPHVPVGRRADYILTARAYARPIDAVGAPVLQTDAFKLYREAPDTPGPATASQRMVQTVTKVTT